MKLNMHLNGFAIRKDLLKEKTVSIFILPEILVKNTAINKITPVKIDSSFT